MYPARIASVSGHTATTTSVPRGNDAGTMAARTRSASKIVTSPPPTKAGQKFEILVIHP